MVHFPGLTRTRLYIQRAVIPFYGIGFPHSDIPGSKPACGSPRLIAACHVLHRLLAPRHPPYALSSLTIKLTQHVTIRKGWASRVPQRGTKDLSISCGTEKSDVEQARLSTNCSARAKFADFVSRLAFVRMPAAIQNASLFSCQRTLCPARPNRPAPGRTSARLFFKRGRNNKKPGIERRAKPSTQPDGFARCSIICYPEFVTDLSSGGYSETLIAPETTVIRQTNPKYIRTLRFVKRCFYILVTKL
jgi:hypothetical protein